MFFCLLPSYLVLKYGQCCNLQRFMSSSLGEVTGFPEWKATEQKYIWTVPTHVSIFTIATET